MKDARAKFVITSNLGKLKYAAKALRTIKVSSDFNKEERRQYSKLRMKEQQRNDAEMSNAWRVRGLYKICKFMNYSKRPLWPASVYS